jgi:hypothetical protein
MFNANKPADIAVVPVVDATSQRAVVTASAEVPTTVMRILNRESMTVSATATAVKVFDGPPPCVFALSKTASPAIDLTGSAAFTGKNCALHANSSATGAIQIGGSASVKADGYCAVGTVVASTPLTPQPESFCDELPDPYANLTEPQNTACDSSKPKVVNDNHSVTTLTAGVYCGGLSLKTDTVLKPGLYVIRDGALSLNAQGSITGKGVTFYLMGSGASFDINGGAKLELSAMETGPYAGLLIVQDRASNEGATSKLNGNSTTVLVGAVYAPTQNLTLNGTGTFGQGSPYMPLIANTVKITGNNTTEVEVDATKLGGVVAPLPKEASGARLVH